MSSWYPNKCTSNSEFRKGLAVFHRHLISTTTPKRKKILFLLFNLCKVEKSLALQIKWRGEKKKDRLNEFVWTVFVVLLHLFLANIHMVISILHAHKKQL